MESQARVFWLLPLLYRTIPRLMLVTIDLAISWIALLIADCRPRFSIL